MCVSVCVIFGVCMCVCVYMFFCLFEILAQLFTSAMVPGVLPPEVLSPLVQAIGTFFIGLDPPSGFRGRV